MVEVEVDLVVGVVVIQLRRMVVEAVVKKWMVVEEVVIQLMRVVNCMVQIQMTWIASCMNQTPSEHWSHYVYWNQQRRQF